MKVRRQMSEGRPGGNARKKKKDNLNNRMALVGVTMVVLSLAVAVHIKGIDLKEKDRSYSIREENLEAQVAKEEERAKQLEEYRVYVQTKQYIEKVAKEKLGLVKRTDNPECRRSWVISLTPLGEEKADKVIELFKMADEVFSDGMTAEEVEKLYALMDVIEKNIEKHGEKR